MSFPLSNRKGGLHYTVAGKSETPLVLLHGSLNDHTSWNQVVPALSSHLRVITYDRRGHSRSESERRRDSIFEDAQDLKFIIEEIVQRPAHVAGTSGGAAIAMRLACREPHLFLSLAAHEPPLIEALPPDGEWGACRNALHDNFAQFRRLMESGNTTEAVAYFVDSLSDGPGAWKALPGSKRDTFDRNAWTLYGENLDTDFLVPDFAGLSHFDKPVLFTNGAKSAPFFARIIEVLVERSLPAARRHTFPDAGHVPHETHPVEYSDVVLDFIRAQNFA